MSKTSLCCQKCKLPIYLDESLLDLSLVQRGSLTNTQYEKSAETGLTNNASKTTRLNKLNNVTDLHQLNNSILNALDSYVFLEEDDDATNNGQESPTREKKTDDKLKTKLQSKQLKDSDSFYGSSSMSDHNGHTNWNSQDGESDDENNITLSRNLKALGNIFNILSSKSKIDHPLCSECCDLLLNELSKQYETGIKERDTYQNFLTKLESQQRSTRSGEESRRYSSGGSAFTSPVKKRLSVNFLENDVRNSIKEQVKEFNNLNSEGKELMKNLEELEKQSTKLDKEIEELKLQEQEILKANEDIMEISNENDLNSFAFLKDWSKLSVDYESLLVKYDDLRKINVYNEMFLISHRGLFGTINNCRIGGYENNLVSWKEINAGMGQVVLLLSCIVNRMKIELPHVQFEPMGSYSKVRFQQTSREGNEEGSADKGEWIRYNCFYDRNSLTDEIKFFFKKENEFDKSLEILLHAISSIQSKIPGSELPYEIRGHKINGISIKLNGSQPTLQWSMACKFMLTNLKWLLAFTSRGI